eukprot:87710_1
MGASIRDDACYSVDTLSPSNGYIQTIARCCDFTDYPSTITYYANNDPSAFQSCELSSETLIGCTAHYEINDDNTSTADATDPYCHDGVSSGEYCCAASCGTCTGSGCAERPGGTKNCCGSSVNDNPSCDIKRAPCMFTRYGYTFPFYDTGVNPRTCTTHIGPITGLTSNTEAYAGAICSDTTNIECVSVVGNSSNVGQDNITSTASCPHQWLMTSCVAFSAYSIIESYFIENDVCVVINSGDSSSSAAAVYALATCCVIKKPIQFPVEVSHFHVSTSVFKSAGSVSYCRDICNSDLASIQSEDEMKYAQHVAYNSPQFANVQYKPGNSRYLSNNVRIGLLKPSIDNAFMWLDDSQFDYGFATLTFNYGQGTYPWSHEQPDHLTDGSSVCVSMLAADDYRWADTSYECGLRTRALCNTCDGELIKYAVMRFRSNKNHAESEAYCKQYLGTNLASIHNQYDFDLAQKLCRFMGGPECWIGLRSPGTFEWTDGTPFDFGTDPGDESIWRRGQYLALNLCYQYDSDGGYMWEMDECGERDEAAICAMPSLLCYPNYWDVANGSGQHSWRSCELHINDTETALDNAFISNQQWINYNGKFVLEFIFKFQFYDDENGTATAGIMILYDEYDWYYIAIEPSANEVQMWKRWKDEYNIVNSVNVTDDWEMYQTMHVTIWNQTYFTVTLNDQISFEYLDTNHNDDDKSRIFSGFIGIRSEYAAIDARYLYVSGVIYPVNQTDIVHTFREEYQYPDIMNTTTDAVNVTVTVFESESEEDDDDGFITINYINVIIGISIGVGICLFILLCCCKKKNKRKQVPMDEQTLRHDPLSTADKGMWKTIGQLAIAHEVNQMDRVHRLHPPDIQPGLVKEEEKEEEKEEGQSSDSDEMYVVSPAERTVGNMNASAEDEEKDTHVQKQQDTANTAGVTATDKGTIKAVDRGEDSVEGVTWDLSDYTMIKQVWMECGVDDWEQYFECFVEHQVSDDVLFGFSKEDENWNVLITKVGPKLKFQKVWFKTANV